MRYATPMAGVPPAAHVPPGRGGVPSPPSLGPDMDLAALMQAILAMSQAAGAGPDSGSGAAAGPAAGNAAGGAGPRLPGRRRPAGVNGSGAAAAASGGAGGDSGTWHDAPDA